MAYFPRRPLDASVGSQEFQEEAAAEKLRGKCATLLPASRDCTGSLKLVGDSAFCAEDAASGADLSEGVHPSVTQSLESLDTRAVLWGSYCRKTAAKENQDGWLVLRTIPALPYEHHDPTDRSIMDCPACSNRTFQWDHATGSFICPQDAVCDNSRNDVNHTPFSSQQRTRDSSCAGAASFSSKLPIRTPDSFRHRVLPPLRDSPSRPLSSLNRRMALLQISSFANDCENSDTDNNEDSDLLSFKPSCLSNEPDSSSRGGFSEMVLQSSEDSLGSTWLSAEKLHLSESLLSSTVLRRDTRTASLKSPWIFAVFDGHGCGGRTAAHVASETLAHSLRGAHSLTSLFQGCSNTPFCFHSQQPSRLTPFITRVTLEQTKQILQQAFESMQRNILQSNLSRQRDFGTTAVVVASLGRYLVTATCGDSSALLIIGLPSKASSSHSAVKNSVQRFAMVNVKMSVDHSLSSAAEIERLRNHAGGRVVIGEGGVLRLIPASCSYKKARTEGLAINMARSLGHIILSQCGLCPQPTFTLIDIADIFELLSKCSKVAENSAQTTHSVARSPSASADSEPSLLFFQARSFEQTIQSKFRTATPSQETSSTMTALTEVSAVDTSDSEVAYFDDTENSHPANRLVVRAVQGDENDKTILSPASSATVSDGKAESTSRNSCEISEPRDMLENEPVLPPLFPSMAQSGKGTAAVPFESNDVQYAADEYVDDSVVVVVEDGDDDHVAGQESPQYHHSTTLLKNQWTYFERKEQATANTAKSNSTSYENVKKIHLMPSAELPSQQSTSSGPTATQKTIRHFFRRATTSFYSSEQAAIVAEGKNDKNDDAIQTIRDQRVTSTKDKVSKNSISEKRPSSENGTKSTAVLQSPNALFNRFFGCVARETFQKYAEPSVLRNKSGGRGSKRENSPKKKQNSRKPNADPLSPKNDSLNLCTSSLPSEPGGAAPTKLLHKKCFGSRFQAVHPKKTTGSREQTAPTELSQHQGITSNDKNTELNTDSEALCSTRRSQIALTRCSIDPISVWCKNSGLDTPTTITQKPQMAEFVNNTQTTHTVGASNVSSHSSKTASTGETSASSRTLFVKPAPRNGVSNSRAENSAEPWNDVSGDSGITTNWTVRSRALVDGHRKDDANSQGPHHTTESKEPHTTADPDKSKTLDVTEASLSDNPTLPYLLAQSSMFLVLMSDGISDVVSTQEIGDFVLQQDAAGRDPLVIAARLTAKAARTRRKRGVRADNCTAVVVKLASHNMMQ